MAGDQGMRPDDDPRPAEPGDERRETQREFERPENEDDDGYDPFSDRPAPAEPTFQEDPWR